MRYKTLGNNGILVSTLCFGTATFHGVAGRFGARYLFGLTPTRSYRILLANKALEIFKRDESQFGKPKPNTLEI